jgi:multidrug efflux pump subunit AcrA (membrane-fusion protein)
LQVNDLKADYARQLSAAESRVADIEAARAAAEQQAQALQQQLESNQALAEQVGATDAHGMLKHAAACSGDCQLNVAGMFNCGRRQGIWTVEIVALSRCSSTPDSSAALQSAAESWLAHPTLLVKQQLDAGTLHASPAVNSVTTWPLMSICIFCCGCLLPVIVRLSCLAYPQQQAEHQQQPG